MQSTEYKLVYKMKLAMKLIEMGHIVNHIMPNPKNNNFNVWVFKNDETFERDLMQLVSDDSRGKE